MDNADASASLAGALAVHVTRLLELESQLAEAIPGAIWSAKAAGATWPELAAATGRTEMALRTRVEKANPETAWRHLVDRRRQSAGPVAPGITIAEAVRRLGRSRPTVDAWIKAGRIKSAKLPNGRRRVLAEPDGTITVAPPGTFEEEPL